MKFELIHLISVIIKILSTFSKSNEITKQRELKDDYFRPIVLGQGGGIDTSQNETIVVLRCVLRDFIKEFI